MRLKTTMVTYGDSGFSWPHPGMNDEEAALSHDAMAAHALLQAMGEIEGTYADCSTAEDVRTFLHERAAEILAGWLGEE